MKAYEAVSEILKDIQLGFRTGLVNLKTGNDVAKRIEMLIAQYGCTSYNKGYKPIWAKQPYPSVCCININHMIAHGVPSDYVFQDGDLVSIDLGIKDKNGDCGDAAITVGIGQLSAEKEKLLRHARLCVYAGIREIKAGVNTRYITKAMEQYALNRRFLVNQSFGGHAIGKEMHEPPHIYNVDNEGNEYTTLKVGQVICLEPMLTTGKDNVGLRLPDGWTVITKDGKPSAVFEHMVRVTEDGYEVLTTHFDDSLAI